MKLKRLLAVVLVGTMAASMASGAASQRRRKTETGYLVMGSR